MQEMRKRFIVSRGDVESAGPDGEAEAATGRSLYAHPDILADMAHACSTLPVWRLRAGGPRRSRRSTGAHSLLLPPDLAQEPKLSALNEALSGSGMHRPANRRRARPWWRGLPLPRAAALVPVESGGLSYPGAVDAWQALSVLRAAKGLDKGDVQRISLEHLLLGAAITGDPVIHCGAVEGWRVISSGVIDDSYIYGAGSSRTPVEVAMDAPSRRPESECAALYGRRPVVAVLDTGVRVHPWIDVAIGDGTKRNSYATEKDGFVQVDQDMQDIIYDNGGQSPDAVTAGR